MTEITIGRDFLGCFAHQRLTSFGYAGATQTYDYNSDGLLVSSAPFTIARRADSGLATTITATGFSLSRTISGYGEVDAADYGAYRYGVTRDAAGRIATKTETVAGVSHTWAYFYDTLGRLSRTERDGVLAESYAFDAQGNRTSYRVLVRGIEASTSATFDAEDRALESAGSSYSYTADGYVASKTTTSGVTGYTYTGLGELESVSLPSGKRIDYRYDASGRRVARLVDGKVAERYLWADNTRLLATYDATGTLTRRFLYADARVPYALDTPSGRYFMAYDQAGSLRAVTDASGRVVERHEADSFGVPLSADTTSSITGLGFAGGLTDPDTGLVLFGARDYDPGTGRWMAKDPIGFAGGDVNLYGYCLSDPVNLVDPSGLIACHAAHKVPEDPYSDGTPFGRSNNNLLLSRPSEGTLGMLVVGSMFDIATGVLPGSSEVDPYLKGGAQKVTMKEAAAIGGVSTDAIGQEATIQAWRRGEATKGDVIQGYAEMFPGVSLGTFIFYAWADKFGYEYAEPME